MESSSSDVTNNTVSNSMCWSVKHSRHFIYEHFNLTGSIHASISDQLPPPTAPTLDLTPKPQDQIRDQTRFLQTPEHTQHTCMFSGREIRGNPTQLPLLKSAACWPTQTGRETARGAKLALIHIKACTLTGGAFSPPRLNKQLRVSAKCGRAFVELC